MNNIFKIAAMYIAAILSLTLYANAKTFKEKATIKDPVLTQKWCSVSAEELKDTYKTNYIVKLTDGQTKQYAALRFLAEDYDAIKTRIQEILAVDAKNQKLINALRAYYVTNSKAKTAYSKFSKIAFEKEADAKEFVQQYGGDIRDFDFTLYLAIKDLELDREFLKAKKEKRYQKGEKIYERLCEKFDPSQYDTLLDLKTDIDTKKRCGRLSSDNLQTVSLYLWEVKRFGDLEQNKNVMKVPQDAKCPVCGMFVFKYPKWAAKIVTQEHTYYFDGVKDLMKFYFNPSKFESAHKLEDFKEIRVTDYYTQKEIDGKKAFYVLHSNVFGPMGNEPIPFEKEEDAKTFLKEHYGKTMLKFDEMTETEVYGLEKLDN